MARRLMYLWQSLKQLSETILRKLISTRDSVASWMRDHPLKKWVSTLSFLAPFGGALTAVQMDEYFAGATLLVVAGLILILWSWFWIGFNHHRTSTSLVKVTAAIAGILIVIFSYPFVISRKEERPWSKTWDYWTTLQTLKIEIAAPFPPPLPLEPTVTEKARTRHPALSRLLPTVQVPDVSVVTQEGLAPHDFRDLTISPGMTRELRRQILTLRNPNSFDLKNLVIRFQLPEPVLGEFQLENGPAGVAVEMNPCRMSMALVGDNASAAPTPEGGTRISTGGHAGDVAAMQMMGEVCSVAMHNPQMRLTGIYQLKIAVLPANELVRIAFLTTNGAAGRSYLESSSGDPSEGLLFFGDGSYQYEIAEQVHTESLFVELKFDSNLRRLTSLPASGEHGKWKIRKMMGT